MFVPVRVERKGQKGGEQRLKLTGGRSWAASLNIIAVSLPLLPGIPGTRRLYF